jgi:hypothetical protein
MVRVEVLPHLHPSEVAVQVTTPLIVEKPFVDTRAAGCQPTEPTSSQPLAHPLPQRVQAYLAA